jgi:nicotinamide-nucleotide amidase
MTDPEQLRPPLPMRPAQLATLANLHAALAARSETVGVAESLTGGLLAAALTTTPGASGTFRGGLVVYATDLKVSLAGVDPILLAARGAVDPAVAIGLAHGAQQRLDADWGIGVTGVAGPEPQDGQPVGTVFVGIVGPAATDSIAPGSISAGADRGFGPERLTELKLTGNRNRIRAETVVRVLDLFLGAISGANGT